MYLQNVFQLEVFSNLNNSVILFYENSLIEQPTKSD